ncbi:MAG: GntR family transcriptional regulator [Acidobacteria bacterium]|nr:GntR family transcriptional regulator [Acidobacteriota bacterium]
MKKARKPRANGFAKIHRRRIADDVYERIRAAILSRRFEPGERIDIPALAETFDVSQMPVRQAIGRLADAGFVEIIPRSGTYIARIDPREIAETFEVRTALERLAAETAVSNLTADELDQLTAMVDAMDETVEDAAQRQRHEELNTEFHRRLVRLSGNRKLYEIYEELEAHIKIARIHSATEEWRARVAQEQTEHRGILKALGRREAAELGQALADHIRRAQRNLLADLERREAAPAAD